MPRKVMHRVDFSNNCDRGGGAPSSNGMQNAELSRVAKGDRGVAHFRGASAFSTARIL